MTPRRPERLPRVLLAGAVFAAIVCSVVIALGADIPKRLPGIALQSPNLYREELGLAHLIGFYFAILIVALALYGKGLVKFGKDGAEVGDVIGQVDAQGDAARNLSTVVREEQRIRRANTRGLEAVGQAFVEKARDDERRFAALERELREQKEKVRALEGELRELKRFEGA